jgi:hypothetical protein
MSGSIQDISHSTIFNANDLINMSIDPLTSKTQCFIKGVYNSAVGAPNHVVYIDERNQIGMLPSSIRYKTDVQSLPQSLIDKLELLRPVTFYMKPDTAKMYLQYGLIAEEVAQILPEIVIFKTHPLTPELGPIPETVCYERLPSLILAAHLALKESHESLKQEVAALRALHG